VKATETIALVAGREIRERVRSKAFLASTGFMLLLIVGGAVVPGLIGDDGPKRYRIGVLGKGSTAVADKLPVVAKAAGEDVTFTLVPVADAAEGDRLARAEDVDVVLQDGRIAVVNKELGDRLGMLLETAHRAATVESALADAGVSGQVAQRVLQPPALSVNVLDPPDAATDEKAALIFIGTFLLYIQLLSYGVYVANGILEEKASRVMEVVLSKARPSHMLTGKLLGIGFLGFVQLVGLVVVGLLAAGMSGSVDLPGSTVRIAVEVVAWFVLGYAFYSACFAMGGALASRTEELQNTTGPISMIGVFSFFVTIFVHEDPGGTVARIATFVPPAAPMVLPIRTAAGEIALWEVAASVALVLLATVAAVLVASRVYAGSALHTRGQMKLRESLRARA
jgi:ABC-2 type transport system permease protein